MKPKDQRLEKTSKNNDDAVPLEEALEMTGFGKYSYAVIITAGINIFACMFTTLVLSIILPATDCDLHLSVQQKGMLTAMVFTGMLFTSHLFGHLADEYGRKYVVVRSIFISGILNVLASFSPNFLTLATITFFNGISVAGVIVPSYVFVGEHIQFKYRSVSYLLTGSIGNLPTAVLPALAIILIPLDFHWDIFNFITFSPWRLLILISAVPSFLGGFAYLYVAESPKFLLSKGFHDETMKVLQKAYSINTGNRKDTYAVKNVCLDEYDSQMSANTETGLKKIWTQCVTLFTKPLLKFTVMCCILQVGIIGACNIIFLWLPQFVTQIMNYNDFHSNYDVTLCDIIGVPGELDYGGLEDGCKVNVPTDTYYVSFVIGILQFLIFCMSGKLCQWFSSKTILVGFILLSAAMSFGLTISTNMWVTIIFLGVIAILLAACIPLAVGIIVEFFPTSARSTASCICLVCGRTASSVGVQVMGLLQLEYCTLSYYGLTIFLIGVGVVAIMLPLKDNPKNPESPRGK